LFSVVTIKEQFRSGSSKYFLTNGKPAFSVNSENTHRIASVNNLIPFHFVFNCYFLLYKWIWLMMGINDAVQLFF